MDMKRLAAASVAWALLFGLTSAPDIAVADPISGSGSTFAYPIIASWSEGFQILRADGTDFVSNDGGVSYELTGSVGGMVRINQNDVDFAATEVPLPSAELEARDLVQFPILIGGVAIVANLPDVDVGAVSLPRAVIADIYLGRITNWSDPKIVASNPAITFPDMAISVVSRIEGSGTTRSFTEFLTLASPDWKTDFGASSVIAWPAGISVKGNSKVIEAVLATPGAIGYAEYGQATRAGLAAVAVENASGAFVVPSVQAFAATAHGADWQPNTDFYLQLASVAKDDAYPITTATFVLMRRSDSSARTRRTLYFFDFALEKGGNRASALGYVPLPDDVVAKVQDYWRKKLPGAEAF